MRSRYAHLRKGTVKVSVGQSVDESTILGIIGESGSINGRHLHFEVYKDGGRIDPTKYLTEPIYVEIYEESTQTKIENNDFKAGDKVLVLSGRLTADSYGGGQVTAEYDGAMHPEDISNYLIIENILDDGRIRPYLLRRTPERGNNLMGWAKKNQIKKI